MDFFFTGPFIFLTWLPLCPRLFLFFELLALRPFECVVPLEPRTTRHSAFAAVAKQTYSTNPERVPACNRRHSNSCKPGASFLPPSVDAKRHLVNTRPRTPVADFAPRGRAGADRIMSECHRPRMSDIMTATPTAAPHAVGAASACEPQETQAPRQDHDQCSHLENLERCRDPQV